MPFKFNPCAPCCSGSGGSGSGSGGCCTSGYWPSPMYGQMYYNPTYDQSYIAVNASPCQSAGAYGGVDCFETWQMPYDATNSRWSGNFTIGSCEYTMLTFCNNNNYYSTTRLASDTGVPPQADWTLMSNSNCASFCLTASSPIKGRSDAGSAIEFNNYLLVGGNTCKYNNCTGLPSTLTATISGAGLDCILGTTDYSCLNGQTITLTGPTVVTPGGCQLKYQGTKDLVLDACSCCAGTYTVTLELTIYPIISIPLVGLLLAPPGSPSSCTPDQEITSVNCDPLMITAINVQLYMGGVDYVKLTLTITE